MPLLGATGNASEYSFRGTYDNYPFDVDFGDLVDAEPGQIYKTRLKVVDGINYKVPISVSGDGEYFVGDITFNETFDSDVITFDQTDVTFDSDFPELDYSTLPNYVRSGDSVAIRVISAEPGTEITSEYYGKTYSTTVTIGKRDFIWTVETKNATTPENFTFDDAIDVEFSTDVTSNNYIVQGLTDDFLYTAEITSNEGLLSVNSSTFVTFAPIQNGDSLRLKLTSSDLNFTTKSATVRIYADILPQIEAFATWNVSTLNDIPSNLTFTDIQDAELNSEVLSELITIQGLSENISFDVSITSTDGLLSVNGSTFVKSTTIRNGQTLQLKAISSSDWLNEKIITVKLRSTFANWKITTKTIEANSDIYADNLIYAIPFNTINQISDMSPEVRARSSLPQGLRASTSIGNTLAYQPQISTERSKFYGEIGSYKLAKGISVSRFEVNGMTITTDQSQVLGYDDFTIEMWIWLNDFNFGGEAGMSIFYPSYIDNRNLNDYFFQLFLKGDNWNNALRFRRGLLLGVPNSNGVVQTICETTSRVLAINSWNHIALTRRSGRIFEIWVNGSFRARGTSNLDLTSTKYNFALPNFQRLVNGDIYIQDLKIYKGIAKYTSNFDISNVIPIMNPTSDGGELVNWIVTRDARLDNQIIFELESGSGPSTITWGPNADIVSTYIQPGSVYILQYSTGTVRLSGNTLELEDRSDNDYNDLTITPDKGTFTSSSRYIFDL